VPALGAAGLFTCLKQAYGRHRRYAQVIRALFWVSQQVILILHA